MFWLLRRLWWMRRSRVMLPVLGLALAAQGWLLVRPPAVPLDSRRLELTDEVARKLAESLPPPAAGRPTLAVLPLERDQTGAVTEAVRQAIARVDHYSVEPASLLERMITECGLMPNTVNFESAEELDTTQLSGEYVLLGRVQVLSARSDRDEAVLEGILIPAGQSLGGQRRQHQVASAPDSGHGVSGLRFRTEPVRLRAEAIHDHRPAANVASVTAWYQPSRLLIWLLILLGLPLVAGPLIQRGLDRQSNGLNLLMLLGLTTAAGLAASTVIGMQIETGVGAALLVLTLALALGYNWWFLSKLEDLRA